MLVLTRERLVRRWSKARLAREAEMNPATVGQIENRVLNPYPSQMAKLAEALDWEGDPAQLLYEDASHEAPKGK